jgi:hypothetical protein
MIIWGAYLFRRKHMDDFKFFTREDVREINRNVISQKSHVTELSEGSKKVLRETRFSRDEINKAFAIARQQLIRG